MASASWIAKLFGWQLIRVAICERWIFEQLLLGDLGQDIVVRLNDVEVWVLRMSGEATRSMSEGYRLLKEVLSEFLDGEYAE